MTWKKVVHRWKLDVLSIAAYPMNMGPTNSLTYLLEHLAAVIGKQSDQVLQEQLGIGLSQYRILMVLEWNPRVAQRVIAESLGQTEASVSRQIKLLEKKGLLISKQDVGNKRRHLAIPTAMGMQITEAAAAILRRSIDTEFGQLGTKQLAQLTANLQDLHKIVCHRGKLGACDHPDGF